jgi:hypothetical protein
MPASKDLGRLFALIIKVTDEAGWVWTAPTFEIEPPFRICRRCILIRLKPFKTALVLGWWRDSGLEEEAALRQALSARIADLNEPADMTPMGLRRTIRDNIAEQTTDLDHEWRVLSMLGIEQDEAS